MLGDNLPKTSEADPDKLFDAFEAWVREERGIELYDAQTEALVAAATGEHVIVATPTGSGKSLVAAGAHFFALANGQRTYYTAPLKALVSEKFFDLIGIFGAKSVGMVTGDTSINAEAPIICCTAEILANIALREGEAARIGQVVMDEFHFYADPQRGWAWQVPLVTLPHTQFILMSATLGDVSFFHEDLTRRTGRDVSLITSTERPVPLTYTYSLTPLPDLLKELTQTHRSPAYVVHFTQAEAVKLAQDLLTQQVAGKPNKEAIAAAIGDFRFGPGFGAILSKLVRGGIGVHHAGMLPKYRRLVEQLAQAGLLSIICGTDTLGVGINVPIKTVVFTTLVKFDGEKMRHLSAREFHQIAGRAGRAGFDTLGEVIVQAPEHVIENAKLLAKAGDDEKKRKKIVRKKAPAGAVNWTDKTFERLRDAEPEALTSQFRVTHAMILNMLERPGDPVANIYRLLSDNHDTATRPAIAGHNPHVRSAIAIYRSLKSGGIVAHHSLSAPPPRVQLIGDLPDNFTLNQPLAPFALAALELLDREAPTFALDVVSVVESTLDDPSQVLYAQQRQAKGEKIAELKAEGYDYDERMAVLDTVTWPRPLAQVLESALATYAGDHPWVADYELSPKSVVRDMVEQAATFSDYIARYDLARSEGIVLRYLTDAYRTLDTMIPDEFWSDELDDIVSWLGGVVRGVDSSLLAQWEELERLSEAGEDITAVDARGLGGDLGTSPGQTDDARPPKQSLSAMPKRLTALIRQAMASRVDLLARKAYDTLAGLEDIDTDGNAWTAPRWESALAQYWDEYEDIGIGPASRAPSMMSIKPVGGEWYVRHILDDPEGDRDWAIEAVVDVKACDAADALVMRINAIKPLS